MLLLPIGRKLNLCTPDEVQKKIERDYISIESDGNLPIFDNASDVLYYNNIHFFVHLIHEYKESLNI